MDKLTHEQILAMTAGRELDQLVAEHILKLKTHKENNGLYQVEERTTEQMYQRLSASVLYWR